MKTPYKLPTVKLRGKEWTLDVRLNEVRLADTYWDRIDLDDLDTEEFMEIWPVVKKEMQRLGTYPA
jgi:hypothetical protein